MTLRLARLLPGLLAGCVFITPDDIDARNDRFLGGVDVWVMSAEGLPLSEATLTHSTGVAEADGAGMVRLDGQTDTLAFTVAAPGFAPSFGALDVVASSRAAWQTRLARLEVAELLSSTRDVSFGVDEQWGVAIPADSLSGGSGPVELAYSVPALGSGSAPPAVDVDGQPVELYAAVYLDSARTVGGTALEMVDALQWRVRIPGSDGLRDRDTPNLYRYDTEQMGWTAVGSVALDEAHALALVDDWGWWAQGSPAGLLGCAAGTADGSGGSLSVWASGMDRVAPWVASVDANGTFCVPVSATGSSVVQIRGVEADGQGVVSLDRTVDAGSVAACGGGCAELGQLELSRHVDADADGFFGGAGGDCNDADSGRYPGAIDTAGDGVDQDCDGTDGVDRDGDGSNRIDDCDDEDPSAAPDAPEVCDGVDNDCDGAVDEGASDCVSLGGGVHASCDRQSVLDLSPVLYWSLDDLESSVAVDSSGWGRHGKYGTAFAAEYEGVQHQGEPTPYFSGVQDEFVQRDNLLGWPSEQFSISFWTRADYNGRALVSYAIGDAPEGRQCVFSAEDAFRRNEFMIQGNRWGTVVFVGDAEYQASTFQKLGAWQHVVFTWDNDGSEVNLFIDGVRVLADQISCDPDDTGLFEPANMVMQEGGTLLLGQDQDCLGGCIDGFQSYEGMFDEMAVFNRVLNETEVDILFQSAHCGEGLQCNGVDEDGDGVVDEHLIGATESCAAASCEAIADAGASVGDGFYWLDADGPVEAFCDMMSFEAIYCGDGIVSPPLETCEGEVGCVDCALDSGLTNCAQILEQDPTAVSGPYWLDGVAVPGSHRVQCEMDGSDGWTRVYRFDTRDNILFSSATVAENDVSQPDSPAYSILGRLEDMRGAGGFVFRQEWPFRGPTAVNEWTQTSNPLDDTLPTGFSPIDVNIGSTDFIGLHLHNNAVDQCFDLADPQDLKNQQTWLDGVNGCDTQFGVGSIRPDSALDYGLMAHPEVGGDGSSKDVMLWVRPN